MAVQSKNGKGFEFACLKAFKEFLENENNAIVILEEEPVTIAQRDYNNLTEELKVKMDKAANAAVRVVTRLEPLLANSKGDKLCLTLQPDKAGMSGDVRDVLAIRKEQAWEIGISCKHNHSAVKHSRLSGSLDFGEKWLNIPCSSSYFEEIKPIFDRLTELKNDRVEWKAVPNKSDNVYIPILNAFMREIKKLEAENPEIVPQRFLGYLLGVNDFYKVISKDNKKVTQVSVFNLYGTLNRNAGKIKPQTVLPKLVLPTRFYDIKYKPGSKNTIIAACDNNWTVSMRIHSAATLVESSLKFDVNLTGIPEALYTHHEPW